MSGIEKFEEEILEMDERIDRLAIACGVALSKDENIVALIKRNFSVCTSGNETTRRRLRGLLMLKYKIEDHCIHSLGTDKCMQIIHDVHEKMRHEGFTQKTD